MYEERFRTTDRGIQPYHLLSPNANWERGNLVDLNPAVQPDLFSVVNVFIPFGSVVD